MTQPTRRHVIAGLAGASTATIVPAASALAVPRHVDPEERIEELGEELVAALREFAPDATHVQFRLGFQNGEWWMSADRLDPVWEVERRVKGGRLLVEHSRSLICGSYRGRL